MSDDAYMKPVSTFFIHPISFGPYMHLKGKAQS
jgi:hypothetical protein